MANESIEMYLLEYLQVIASCKTLAEAAEILHVTQPTLTRALQKLESVLDVKLFHREHNRLYLNDCGKLALSYASRIVKLESEMIEHIRLVDRNARMIIVGSCTPGPILEVVQELQVTYPEKRIASEVRMPEALIEGLRKGEYNMIIMDRPCVWEGYLCGKLGTEVLYVNVVPGHRLASYKTVSFKDINGYTFPILANLGIWRKIIEEHMPDSHFLPQYDLDVLTEIADYSTFPTFDSDSRIRMYGNNKNRITIPIVDKAGKLDCYCVCKECDRKMFEKWVKNSCD